MLDHTPEALAPQPASNVPIHFVECGNRSDVAAEWLLHARRTLERPLAERGLTTSHGAALRPAAINLATAASLSRLWLPYFRSFMVGVRADHDELVQCDWEILPTGLDVTNRHRSAIAPWSSASTIARNSSRLDQVANLAFFSVSPGFSRWRAASGQVEQLLRLGVSCRIVAAPLEDLSDTDVLVADCAELRRGSGSFLSPLVAAWRAGIPAILIDGEPERSQRSSALDYLSIDSPERLVETVAQLQSHPLMYEAMRQCGAEHARELRDNLVTKRWVDCLADMVAPVAASTLEQRLARPIRAMSLQAGRWLVQQGRRRSLISPQAATSST